MNDEDIQQIFFAECEEALETAEAGLGACKAGTHDAETINAIFRGVHSIKGGAGAFGHAPLQAYTHSFENLLSDIREGTVPLDASLTDLLLLALDLLRHHVDAARDGTSAPEDAAMIAKLEAARESGGGTDAKVSVLVEPDSEPSKPAPSDDLDGLLDELCLPPLGKPDGDADASASADEPAAHTDWLVHIRPHAGALDNGGEPLLLLREIERLGGQCVACDVEAVPPLTEMRVDEGYFGWTFRMPGEVSQDEVAEIFDFVGDDCAVAYGPDAAIPPCRAERLVKQAGDPDPAPQPEAPASPAERRPGASAASQSVRIDLSKLDKLIDGVGELVIAQAMLAQRLENESFAHIEELAMLDTLVRDIQESAMAFRAQPISSVFGRVPRLLRELVADIGKNVNLKVSGETTELDKTVIERLSEPMTHLIRNAVDHGIEPPEERVAAGKDPQGTLSLSAEQKAGRIVIEISDDGRGIDRERVLAKAVANGIVSADAELSDEEINQLIFAPGFSTAAEVTSVSGRGVGMDVVKSNVKDLGGRITITSTAGKGTTFTLALPLTLAISDGMIVQTGDQSLVIPLAHVIESLRPVPADVKGMGTSRQLLNVRGRFVPIITLGKVTGAHDYTTDPASGVLVLVEAEGYGEAALLVDTITDQRQFVIKSLEANYRQVETVAGATILGNGEVALIVDVDNVVQAASSTAPSALAA